jgi:D-sedoheptulose 7-phosphate isomerase
MKKKISSLLMESSLLKKQMATSDCVQTEVAIRAIVDCLTSHHKILICGNGGSAADAQHFAAEFINRFKIDRNPFPAVALTTDASILTSISNDSGFDHVFEKQVQALGLEGDVLIVITTSDISFEKNGHSTNIALALHAARQQKIKTVGLVAQNSKKILQYLDVPLIVPSTTTPRIQEAHITLLHIICELAEQLLSK